MSSSLAQVKAIVWDTSITFPNALAAYCSPQNEHNDGKPRSYKLQHSQCIRRTAEFGGCGLV